MKGLSRCVRNLGTPDFVVGPGWLRLGRLLRSEACSGGSGRLPLGLELGWAGSFGGWEVGMTLLLLGEQILLAKKVIVRHSEFAYGLP